MSLDSFANLPNSSNMHSLFVLLSLILGYWLLQSSGRWFLTVLRKSHNRFHPYVALFCFFYINVSWHICILTMFFVMQLWYGPSHCWNYVLQIGNLFAEHFYFFFSLYGQYFPLMKWIKNVPRNWLSKNYVFYYFWFLLTKFLFVCLYNI